MKGGTLMEYKLVAIDLDDTLLSDDLKISHQTIKAIQETVKRGVTVTLATGRMYKSAVQYAKEIDLNVPIITYQGAYVKNIGDGKVLYERLLSYEVSIDIISKLKERGKKNIKIYIDDELYADKENLYVAEYGRVSNVNYHIVDDLIDLIDQSKNLPLKILAIDEPEEINHMLKEFNQLYQDKINITISKPHFLEFSHREATKGQAIKYLAAKLGISLEQVIAIGDSHNDLDMIQVAGLGVVMENGYDEVKKYANYITKTNNDHGVFEVLNRFILNAVE